MPDLMAWKGDYGKAGRCSLCKTKARGWRMYATSSKDGKRMGQVTLCKRCLTFFQHSHIKPPEGVNDGTKHR
jgi:hypothetical protein